MANCDYYYFYARAEIELEHAQRATHAKVVSAHYQLAEAYIARVSALAADPLACRQA